MSAGTTKPLAPVCAIVGADRFLRAETLKQWMGEGRGSDGFGPSRFDGARATAAEVLDEVRTPTLLGGTRVVIVDDADDLISRHRDIMERYCAAPVRDGHLVLLCDSLPRNQRIYKVISGKGEVIPCEAPKGRGMTSWITARAQRTYDKRLSADAAQLLRDQIGDEPGALDSELAKLAAYVGDRPAIAPADIEAVTDCHREEKVFAVVDALAMGNTAEAVTVWNQVLATDRAAPGRAIAGIAWAVRSMLEARRELDAGGSVHSFAPRLRVDPEVLRRRLERLTTGRLERMQRDLLRIDLAIKTGEASIEAAIESFIVSHSGGATARA